MATVSKRKKQIQQKVDTTRTYSLPEAAALVKECASAKFDETVELAFLLGVDPRHAEQMVRGAVSLPHGTGRTMSGGLDSQAMAKPNAFFGSARAVASTSGGGRLTLPRDRSRSVRLFIVRPPRRLVGVAGMPHGGGGASQWCAS